MKHCKNIEERVSCKHMDSVGILKIHTKLIRLFKINEHKFYVRIYYGIHIHHTSCYILPFVSTYVHGCSYVKTSWHGAKKLCTVSVCIKAVLILTNLII